ncbi:RagB/SusD family nutrient uptake outer membrane protein [Niastella sp. OAS944]|uniref:RagB/SusD family nutrient uptake outer membrane protein n=1 Tax=Niastella sp. OAS944 TaxID=2664089 RepID=UPI00348E8995|nr:hypothetical protein [Chitinophagaceae bacterium OAS944]
MKTYLLLVGLALIMLAGQSCNKFLDVKPKDIVIDKDFFKDFYDADYALRGAYAGLQPLIESMFVTGEMRADFVKPGPGVDTNLLELAEHRVTATNKYTNWKVYYDLINRANYLIKYIPRVPNDAINFTEDNARQYVGEALFLRAFAYFYLVRNFSHVPLVLTPTDSIQNIEYLPPSPENVILDTLEANLTAALTMVKDVILIRQPNLNLAESPDGRRTRGVTGNVNCLLADIYLWRHKYEPANAAIQKIYNLGKHNLYGSAAAANFFDIFYATDHVSEPIFHINFNYNFRETHPMMMLTSDDAAWGGKYMIAPADNIAGYWDNKLVQSGDTLRLVGDVRGFGAAWVGTRPYYNDFYSGNKVIWKYLGLGRILPSKLAIMPPIRQPYRSDAIWQGYRFAEVILMKAEALNRMGDKAGAITQVNRIRSRYGAIDVIPVTVNSTTEQIEDYIFKERARELAFEGKRWFDLLRLARRGRPEILKEAIKTRMGIVRYNALNMESKLADAANWYLPFNAEEVKLNPYLR